jgi:hypothetical protein
VGDAQLNLLPLGRASLLSYDVMTEKTRKRLAKAACFASAGASCSPAPASASNATGELGSTPGAVAAMDAERKNISSSVGPLRLMRRASLGLPQVLGLQWTWINPLIPLPRVLLCQLRRASLGLPQVLWLQNLR